MRHHQPKTIQQLLCGTAAVAICAWGGAASAEERAFNIEAQSLSTALMAFGTQSGHAVMAPMGLMGDKTTRGFSSSAEPEVALAQLLEGTGLTWRRTGDTFAIVQEGGSPQGGSAAGGGATVEALIVTAQKREEDIQDVPIAISAFSQEDLTRSQVAGGPDLMTQVPNMTFTKTNFTGYSIQIRGIGTQAISATTDAAVAVAFNNTPFIRNRFFEQEFYDLQRVEVLRGPQGTLYGRNATAGVVNIISAKPKFYYEARASADLSNYSSSRLEAMVNVPLVEDAVALRLAGAWTKRDGFVTNEITGSPIDGRDLWSTRLSLRISPNDRLDANLIWEHFEEDDDRLRSGKQLCKTDIVTSVGDIPITSQSQQWENPGNSGLFSRAPAAFSRGCEPSSLYSPDSFQTPNGISLPYYLPLSAVFLPAALDNGPYVNDYQSRDLRVIESTVDPEYRARSDLGELQISFDVTDNLTLASETAYARDVVFSQQDFNRFNTARGAWEEQGPLTYREGVITINDDGYPQFCDPQIGCADRLVALDLSTAKSTHFSQEVRLSSSYDGQFNFSLGANFLRYDTEDKYYVFINSVGLISTIVPFGGNGDLTPYVAGVTDNRECLRTGVVPGEPSRAYPVIQCVYIDPNPIGSLNDQGHNYFLSKNPYKLISYAAFGEVYYNVTERLNITGGFRWTVDKKEAPRVPSWLLASNVAGYPVAEVIELEWREPTGRLAIDWKPDLSFTDETLVYGSFAHGYKAGGANPPGFVRVYYGGGAAAEIQAAQSETRPKTFDPEFINAFELGTKNTLANGKVTLNLGAFYYDYEGYQISEIVDRSAFNRNFDATVWGIEIEADWRPLENLKFGFKGGYEKTRIVDGEQAVDLMDRTAGDPDWILVRPFPTFASNCILPVSLFDRPGGLYKVGNVGGGGNGPCELAYILGLDPVTEAPYDPDTHITNQGFSVDEPYLGFDPYSAPNFGEGIFKDLSGNELPNAPNFTATITADYTVPLSGDWLATLHTDIYYQSEAWWRVFNTEGYDKLKAYTNINLAAIFTNEPAGWKVMAYVKNVFDRDSITGAFLNSDDTGLTTNVFLTEPRLYGLRVTKEWTGGPLLGSFGGRRDGPYPFTVELGGQAQRHDAPNQIYAPEFLGAFDPAIDLRGTQDEDLDWGDGREVKLTYAATDTWRVSVAARSYETNASHRLLREGERFCFVGDCGVQVPQARFVNYGLTEVREGENHDIVEFSAGRDIGMGMLGMDASSSVSLGLRYASLASMTRARLSGIPDWVPPTGNFLANRAQHHEYIGLMSSDREFEGGGPVITWEAAKKLLGDGDSGHLDLDWSLTGGVLFGKQKTQGGGYELAEYSNEKYLENPAVPVTSERTPFEFDRSKSVTVPVVGASLGLVYEVDRFRAGAGYRWERYFDAIDGGIAKRQQYDRTIDGPYFKLSVGFGGG